LFLNQTKNRFFDQDVFILPKLILEGVFLTLFDFRFSQCDWWVTCVLIQKSIGQY